MCSTVFRYTYYILVYLRHWIQRLKQSLCQLSFPDNRLDLQGDRTVSVLLDTTIFSFQNVSLLPHLQLLFYPGYIDLAC